MAQIGSWARAAPSALDKARSAATGAFRSAILTYLGQIIIPEPGRHETMVLAGPLRTDCTRGARALSWAEQNIPGVAPRRKSIRTEWPWQRNLMTASRG